MEFKGKEARAVCYTARDAYFDCIAELPVDKNNKAACQKLFETFEKNCGHKWTEHFIRKRDYLKFKEQVAKEGVEAIDKKKL